MTIEERVSILEAQLLSLQSDADPTEYYTSKYSGEEQDAFFDWVNAQMNPAV